MRLFIAVKFSNPIKDSLLNTMTQLKMLKADVSWVEEKNLHLTLKFLGETDKSRIKGIVPLLDELASEIKPFQISLGKLGAFPDAEHPKTLWAGLNTGKLETIELCKKLDETLIRAAFKREEKPFNPHITLGRCKGVSSLSKLTEALKNTVLPLLSQPVTEFYLVKSELLPEGAVYKDLQTFRLNTII